MIADQELEFDGRKYRWQVDPLHPSPDCWVEARSNIQPSVAVSNELSARFLCQVAPGMVSKLDADEVDLFKSILRSMNASRPQINRIIGMADAESSNRPTEKPTSRKAELQATTPFTCPAIRDWYFAGRSISVGCPRVIALIGSDPFKQQDLRCFVQRFGVVVRSIDGETTVAVVGRTDWSESEIDRLIDDRFEEEGMLRIYSQEMFLTHMGASDPFLASEEALNEFMRGHPALEFVASGWPGWVQPWVRGRSAGSGYDRVERSPLKVLGYCVGASGLHEAERRSILRRAFEEPLPFVESVAYMDEWGEPGTPVRLRRIAELIASNCRSAYGRGLEEAFVDWFRDLLWLKSEYYHGHFTFHWPDDCLTGFR